MLLGVELEFLEGVIEGLELGCSLETVLGEVDVCAVGSADGDSVGFPLRVVLGAVVGIVEEMKAGEGCTDTTEVERNPCVGTTVGISDDTVEVEDGVPVDAAPFGKPVICTGASGCSFVGSAGFVLRPDSD